MIRELVDQVKWLRQTVHQAHHEGPIEACTKSTCHAARGILTLAETGRRLPKIFVFCNTPCGGRGDWHAFVALAEDGTDLAWHLCSSHAWGVHDMGLTSSWKRDIYDQHYPGGYELVWIGDPKHPEAPAGFAQAIELNRQKADAEPKDAA